MVTPIAGRRLTMFDPRAAMSPGFLNAARAAAASRALVALQVAPSAPAEKLE